MHSAGHHKPKNASQPDTLIQRAYATYFRTGHYADRYPCPNPTVWRHIKRHATQDTRLLDYGCGTGRYLLALQAHVGEAAGFDISAEALHQLKLRALAQGWETLTVLGPKPEALDRHLQACGPSDLVLCLFGVVAHIVDPALRREVLLQIRRAVKPGTGRLLISVPNSARRFRAEQRHGRDGVVTYSRDIAGEAVVFTYQLFDVLRLHRELEDAGFRVEAVRPESLLPESWLLTKTWARWLDGLLTPICPARWGYGLFAEAT